MRNANRNLMLDRSSPAWSSAPHHVKIGLYLLSRRSTALAFEYLSAAVAVLMLVGALLVPPLVAGSLFFGAAYWYASSIRWVDNAGLWVSGQEASDGEAATNTRGHI